MTGAALLACDVGPHDDETYTSEDLHVLAVSVREDLPHDADTPIEISFDRLLRPSSAVRQSFVIRDAFGVPVESPIVEYDPVLRLVRLSNPRLDRADPTVEPWMLDNQPYTLTLGIPKEGEEGGGFRALDGATLGPKSKRRWGFVAHVHPQGPSTADKDVFCTHVMPIFQAKCVQCHGPSRTDMGLDLSTGVAVQKTAIGRLSRLTATGSSSTLPTAAQAVFGRDMAIVDPRSPGTSTLLYKVLLAAPSAEAATTPACRADNLSLWTPLVPYFAGLDARERAKLSGYLRGQSMPLGSSDGAPGPGLTLSEQRVLSAWIAAGARTNACAACP